LANTQIAGSRKFSLNSRTSRMSPATGEKKPVKPGTIQVNYANHLGPPGMLFGETFGGTCVAGRVESESIELQDGRELQKSAEAGYRAILEHTSSRGLNLARVWNYIPGINRSLDADLDAYMAFGVGRYNGFQEHYSKSFSPAAHLPASTGIGAPDDRLILEFLATAHEVRFIQNNKQAPPHLYSPLYGPRPPCFTRATLLKAPHELILLLAGTASVIGEKTTHAGDLQGQFEQTIELLEWLIGRANLEEQGIDAGFGIEEIRNLIVYYTCRRDRHRLEKLLSDRLPGSIKIEIMHRSLCRQDLLVEIEGVLRSGGSSAG
jgi:chorismate lyase/3-hydroxybenzoate synthase